MDAGIKNNKLKPMTVETLAAHSPLKNVTMTRSIVALNKRNIAIGTADMQLKM